MTSYDNEGPPIKGLVGVVLAGIMLVGALFLPTNLFENLSAQEVMVIQAPFSGSLSTYIDPGVKWQGFGRVTKYEKRTQFWFSEKNDQGEKTDQSIKVRFNDGGHAQLSGSLAWELPLTHDAIVAIHSKYGSQHALEQQLIRTVVEKSVYMTGPLMSSKESYAERRNDLIRFIEDQTINGVYQTTTEQVKETDPMTGAPRTVNLVRLVESKPGIPARQEASPLSIFGVRVFNLSLNSITYDPTVEAQIQGQQQAVMQVQTAVANAKKAEQDAITAAKSGEAEAAKAKWAQEAIKAKAVTEGEQELAVATLARQTAEQNKQEQILLGQGEAERRRLNLAANGALEQKLAAYVEVNKNYAEALKGMTVPIVPGVVMGNESGGRGGNSAQDLIDLIKIKTAKELAVDVAPKQ